ncbi:MAG TPA: hypothetical protein PKY52_07790 [Methanofastidiosum sp.]|nr:hypothetical protein [Methanofastidiosum sp.]
MYFAEKGFKVYGIDKLRIFWP